MWSSSVSRPVLASLRTKPPRVNRPGPKAIICEKKQIRIKIYFSPAVHLS